MSKVQKYFNKHTKVYYLVFTDTPTWRKHFLKKGCGHVFALTHDEYNWLLLNPRHLFLHTEILPLEIKQQAWHMVSKPSDKVLRIELYQKDNEVMFGGFGLRNCVSVVKYMLGFKHRAITPYQLYKSLLKMNEKQRNMHGIHSVHIKQ